jgi:hypothetical protein
LNRNKFEIDCFTVLLILQSESLGTIKREASLFDHRLFKEYSYINNITDTISNYS